MVTHQVGSEGEQLFCTCCQIYSFLYFRFHPSMSFSFTLHPLWSLPGKIQRRREKKIQLYQTIGRVRMYICICMYYIFLIFIYLFCAVSTCSLWWLCQLIALSLMTEHRWYIFKWRTTYKFNNWVFTMIFYYNCHQYDLSSQRLSCSSEVWQSNQS